MDKAKAVVDRLTAHFDTIPKFKKLADMTHVPSGCLALAVIFLALFLVFSDLGSHITCDFIGIVYPAYISFKAIETKEEDDDK
jgi:receptor expression-enhancing protein 5/6